MDEVVELIVASILEKIIEKVRRRTSNKELIPSKEKDADQNRIDLNFGEIHEEVKAPNENTMEIFVPYGVPTIGSYGTPVFKNGIPITDKRKNYMPIPEYGEYGFYVDVPVSFGDFEGIKDSGESFKKIWDAKGYEEKVRVIALNDNEVLTSKTPEAFASWFSRKLANGYLRWCKLNRPAMNAAAAAGATTATVDGDAYTIQSEEEEEVIAEEEAEEVHTTDEDEVGEARDGGEAAMATNGLVVVFGDDDDEKDEKDEREEKDEKDE